MAQIPLVSLENIEIDTLVEKIGDVKLGLFTFSDIFLNDDKTLPHLSKALQWAAARDAVKIIDGWKHQFPETKLTCIGKIVAGEGIVLNDKYGSQIFNGINGDGYVHFS